MQETARGIFRERLNILRDRFAHAAREEHWNEAIRIGETIIAEHPQQPIGVGSAGHDGKRCGSGLISRGKWRRCRDLRSSIKSQ